MGAGHGRDRKAIYAKIDAGSLGAAFYIPAAIVPPLLVTHALILGLLLGPKNVLISAKAGF